jgi:hypothetical protein
VHVCRRWRHIVFGSPHRLNLELTCTGRTPTRDRLDIWPALPLNIDVDEYDYEPIRSVDDIVAGLQVFGSWAGELSPQDFAQFAIPPLQHIVISVRARHSESRLPAVPIILFAKGANAPVSLAAAAAPKTVLKEILIPTGDMADARRSRMVSVTCVQHFV